MAAPLNLFEQQASNKRRTRLLVVVFVAFLMFLGYGFDRFYLGIEGAPVGAVLGLLLGSFSAMASYYGGAAAVLLTTGAKDIDALIPTATAADRLKYAQLDNVVSEMAIASGLPKPRVCVVPDSDPNAFATGRDPDHAAIAVTDGLLDALNREELQGVVAHEMSHIRNYDIRLMTFIAALVGAVALLSDFSRRGMSWGGGSRRSSDRDRDGGNLGVILLVLWLVAIVLAPILGQMMAMMVSRRRESLADASGAELTRNPLGLASALEKIDAAAAPTASITRGTAHLCIEDPLGRSVNEKRGWFADLFASHPPIADRIAALKGMAFQAAP